MNGTTTDERVLLDAVRKSHAGAYELAKVVSLAARVEPALVRRARVELLPRLGAGDEADFWFGPLVQARSPLAVVFAPAVAELLRLELSKDQKMLRDAWRVTKRVHEKSSPVILLEEQVTYLALSDEPDAAERIRALLISAARAMVEGDGRGLAQWALRALPRLPESARESEAAWALAVGAGARLGGRRILEGEAPDAMSRSMLRWVLPREHKQAEVGVRLLEAGVELGEPPAEGAHVIRLPKTDPLLLELSWGAGGETASRQVTLSPGQTQVVETGSLAEVSIGTPTGDTFTVRREYEFDVFVDASALGGRLAPRLRGEEWQGRPFRVAVAESAPAETYLSLTSKKTRQSPVEPAWAAGDESLRERRASRKVIEDVGEYPIDTFRRRAAGSSLAEDNDPRVIPVYAGSMGPLPPELQKYVRVDFSDRAHFEENYRRLLALVKDEPYAETPGRTEPVKVLYVYAHQDAELKKVLEEYLAPLRGEGLIESWGDRELRPGEQGHKEAEERINSTDLFLILVSPDFFASEPASEEISRAMDRGRESGYVGVVPVLLRPSDWVQTPLGGFKALPADGRALASRVDMDEAFQEVARGVETAAREIARQRDAKKARDASGRPRVFIGHSLRDAHSPMLNALTAELQRADFDIILDRGLQSGEVWRPELSKHMAQADAAVILLSKSALKSPLVRREASVLFRRRRSDENFFLLTVLLEGVGVMEAGKHLGVDPRETEFITAAGPPAATARQVVEAFTQFRERKNHEPPYAERLEKLVAARLRDVPDKVLLSQIKDVGEGRFWPDETDAPRDMLARLIVRGGLYQLGGTLRRMDAYLSESDAWEIIELVAPTWVNPEAAAAVRRVATGPRGRRALCVNCRQPFTARTYIDRANEGRSTWKAVEMSPVSALGNLSVYATAEIDAALRVKLNLDDHSDLEKELALRERAGEPLFIIIPPPLPPLAYVETIKSAFPTVTLFLMGGEQMPRLIELSPGDVEMIHPPLEPGEEEKANEEYRRLRVAFQRRHAE